MRKVSEVVGCIGCPMRRLFPDNTFVEPKKGSGDRLVIAEAPGFDETLTGEPLTGGAGSWFNIIAGKAGLKRDELTLCNIIQCRPLNNVFPTDPDAAEYISPLDAVEAIDQCRREHVDPLLHSKKWKRIDLLGAKPLEFIAEKSGGIFKWRGSPITIPGLGDKPIAIATLHPAYIMRDQTMLPVAINDLRKTLAIPPEDYNLYPSLPDVKAFTATEFAFDIETAYWSSGSPQITMVGLCAEPYKAIVVPFTGAYKTELQRIFRAATSVIGHNCLQFDLPILQDHGVELGEDCTVWDTMLLQHLRFPDLPHDLEFVGSQFSNKPAWKSDKAVFELYNARDVDVTLQCYKALRPMCKAAGLEELYLNVQVPLARICKLMSDTGFTINPNKIGEVREKLLAEMKREEQHLPEYLRTRQVAVKKRQPAPPGTLGKSGKPVKFLMVEATEEETPWRSAKEIEKYLYTTLALPVQNDLKTDRVTTGKLALDKLYRRTKDRSLLALKKLRQMNSLVTLFCKEQMLDIDKMHPHFNVQGTACLAPETLVCTPDLRWIPLSSVEEGDILIGFEEMGRFRKLQPATVLKKQEVERPTFRVVLSNGVIVEATDDHGWLLDKRTRKNAPAYNWYKTTELRVGDKVGFWRRPWPVSESRDGGYIAGFLDGEGCVHRKTGGLHFSQNRGTSLETIKTTLTRFGCIWHETPSDKKLKHVHISDGIRVVGMTRPERLLERARSFWEGRSCFACKGAVYISAIQPLGNRRNIGLTTTTATIIANGVLTHNSGRLSSSDPNLQNVPESARYIYVPAHPGWKIIDVDYSQIENRLTAYFANDTERMERFIRDPKFSEHKFAASLFLGCAYDEVEKDNDKEAPYGKAKRIVHGTNYGMGARKISLMYDMDFKDIKALQDKWKNAIYRTIQWQNITGDLAKKQGYLTTPFGRKRWLYTSSYFTEALSFLPQSTAADIIFRAMIGLMYERIHWPVEQVQKIVQIYEPLLQPAELLLQVHDSLVIQAPVAMVDAVVAQVRRVMEQPWKELGGLTIPIGVKCGDSWGECE